jgi:hypothetical protein
MGSDSSKSGIERISTLLRSVLALGARTAQQGFQRLQEARSGRSTGQDEGDSVRSQAESASGPDRARSEVMAAAEEAPAEVRNELPDLDASESDFAYSGEPGAFDHPPQQAGTGGPASAAAESIRATSGDHSDFDDAEGEAEQGDEAFLPDSSDLNEAFRLHDAVGRHERSDADDDMDGPIDTGRDLDLAGRQRPDELDEHAVSDITPQEEAAAFEGAGTDEFTRGGYEPVQVEPEDIEAAAGGESADIPDDASTSDIGELGQENDQAGGGPEAREIQDFNYGVGDLGVGRTDGRETSEEGDAVSQVSDGDTVESDTEPESSNDPIDARSALGSTLDHTEESSDFLDPDSANLSGEPEMSVVEDEPAWPPVAGQDSVDTPDHPYADISAKPTDGVADDAGTDDFTGGQYPSDLLVDRLDGDDAFDAIEPDIGTETSSAGDVDPAGPDENRLIQEASRDEMTGSVIGEDSTIDQEMLSTEDDSIGDAPTPSQMARGTDSGVVLTEADATAAGITHDGDGGEEQRRDDDIGTGAVRGDGTTSTPEGYPVKGNASSKIYHLPHFPSYASTKAEFCFATEQDAINAGFRAPGRRNQGRAGS